MLASIVVVFAETSEICIIMKPRTLKEKARFSTAEKGVRVYLVGYIFCIIDYHICRDIFGRLYILYNRLSYMSGYIW
jgi:hypothetical protein